MKFVLTVITVDKREGKYRKDVESSESIMNQGEEDKTQTEKAEGRGEITKHIGKK